MLQRDSDSLRDMLISARPVARCVSGRTFDEFVDDIQFQDSVIRRIEIIGEAARRVSEEVRNSLPNLPWGRMAGMRNPLIHGYDGIDLYLTWDTATSDVASLIELLERLLEREDPAP